MIALCELMRQVEREYGAQTRPACGRGRLYDPRRAFSRASAVFQRYLCNAHFHPRLRTKTKDASSIGNYSCGFVDHLVGNQSPIHETTRKKSSVKELEGHDAGSIGRCRG